MAALHTDKGRVKLYIRGANGLIYEAADLCFADDLITISPTLAGMQRKADIIGGFAEIIHLRISVRNSARLRRTSAHKDCYLRVASFTSTMALAA